jgi:uncharacterized protein YkwD
MLMPIGHDRPVPCGKPVLDPPPIHDAPADRRLPMRSRRRPAARFVVAAWSLLPALAAAGCAVASSPTSPTATASSAGGAHYEAEVALCVSETNRLRSGIGRPPLARSADLEAYAAAAARTDGMARTPHQHAQATNHGNGVAVAENELLYWNLSHYRSVQNVIVQGLSQMWQQGEGSPHYENMAGRYRQIGCGVFVQGDDVSVVQAFR